MTDGTIAFGSPWFLLGLIPVAAAGAYLVWRRRRHLEPALRYSATQLVDKLPRSVWAQIAWLPDALRITALVLVVVALARPQILGKPYADDSEGIDIILALDTSCSMRAADFQPRDRMFVAKQSIAELVKQRSVDRIGLVVFGSEAASWVPLTLDYALLVEMLDEVEVGMLPDGTAIGSAIATSLNRLRESDATSRVVVLLTDGDSNSGSITPKRAAEFAKTLGIAVYPILIGRGGEVPFPAGKDLFGRPVYSRQVIPTNPALLRDIAKTTGGAYYEAKDGEELDSSLSEVLDTLEKTQLENTVYTTPREELFVYVLALGLALLALELLLSATRLRRFP
ncbi:MAG: VWA domain-containing protein [Deltaproteobacteria bacterium]